jgi:hypothetical protein
MKRYSLFRLIGNELVYVRSYSSRGGAAGMCQRHPGEFFLSPYQPGDDWTSIAA